MNARGYIRPQTWGCIYAILKSGCNRLYIDKALVIQPQPDCMLYTCKALTMANCQVIFNQNQLTVRLIGWCLRGHAPHGTDPKSEGGKGSEFHYFTTGWLIVSLAQKWIACAKISGSRSSCTSFSSNNFNFWGSVESLFVRIYIFK